MTDSTNKLYTIWEIMDKLRSPIDLCITRKVVDNRARLIMTLNYSGFEDEYRYILSQGTFRAPKALYDAILTIRDWGTRDPDSFIESDANGNVVSSLAVVSVENQRDFYTVTFANPSGDISFKRI